VAQPFVRRAVPYSIRLEHQDARPLAVVRRQAKLQDLPAVVPAACGTVWNALKANQVPGAGRHIAVYLDDEINLEVGNELDTPTTAFGELIPSMTPAGTVATTTHVGPYELLKEAHIAIREWCAAQGHRLAGPNWEVYGHWRDEWNKDPGKIVTDVFYLIGT
jgi:effector-binding domain-containing protein